MAAGSSWWRSSAIALVFACRMAPAALELALDDGVRAPVAITYSTPTSEARRAPLTEALTTPLGSLWKLFVYVYLVDKKHPAPPYFCSGKRAEERFCCKRGGHIEREAALASSCGLFFDPVRLGLSASAWSAYWRALEAPRWLAESPRLSPKTRVRVKELLGVLRALRERRAALLETRTALEAVLTSGTASGAVRSLGGTVRVKTFTWNDPKDPRRFVGGFAGWLGDGTAVWARSDGASHEVVTRWGDVLAQALARAPRGESRECVDVSFLEHYPIRAVTRSDGASVGTGPLSGEVLLRLRNGKKLALDARENFRLARDKGELRLMGRFPIDEYVARVLQREVETKPEEAAKALAIVIRSFLYQNARTSEGCFVAPDTTRFQRVSLTPPSDEARRIAAWTDGLGLEGARVHYHSIHSSPGTLGWETAKRLAREGRFFDEILRISFPGSRLVPLTRSERCTENAALEAWLERQSRRWRLSLEGRTGFEPPARIKVCALDEGPPFVDYERDWIFARTSRGLLAPEDEIALAHEYLHLAFRHHPLGRDQAFVEATARRLLTLGDDG